MRQTIQCTEEVKQCHWEPKMEQIIDGLCCTNVTSNIKIRLRQALVFQESPLAGQSFRQTFYGSMISERRNIMAIWLCICLCLKI